MLKPAEWSSWYGSVERAFAATSAGGTEVWRSVIEFDRAVGMWDGGAIVGTASSYSLRTTVPGGARVATGGLAEVSVATTHRRRGLLREMLRWQLDDTRRRGEPLAALTASEPAIYGRFGYGVATHWMSVDIDTDRTTVAPPPDDSGITLRYVDPAEGLAECEAVYARALPSRPGRLERPEAWQRLQLFDPPEHRDGATPLQCVQALRDGQVVGYVRYRVTARWDEGGACGQVGVRELEADDIGGYAALWRFLADIDLTSRITADKRPPDDGVLHLVADIRRTRRSLRDGLFLRPVDVGAALAARTYQLPVDVVLEVRDDFCPWNAGRWRLSGDAAGARCEPTRDPAELSLSAAELGAAYLGGTSLASLADAGKVTEHRRGALAVASSAFGSPRAPFLPHGF